MGSSERDEGGRLLYGFSGIRKDQEMKSVTGGAVSAGIPQEICERMGIESQDDPRLEEATQEIYKAGFHTGVLNYSCMEYEGMRVEKAKDMTDEELEGKFVIGKLADRNRKEFTVLLRELNESVQEEG